MRMFGTSSLSHRKVLLLLLQLLLLLILILLIALWIIDETEARWLRLVTENPSMEYTEVYWTTTYANSINEAASKIAKVASSSSLLLLSQ